MTQFEVITYGKERKDVKVRVGKERLYGPEIN